MRPATLIAVSLALNLTLLVALALRPSFAPPVVREFLGRHFRLIGASAPAATSSPISPAKVRPTVSSPEAPPLLGAAFSTDDFSVLSARLRAAGFPAAVVAEILRKAIDAHYEARIRAVTDLEQGAPFWKSSLAGIAAAGRRNEQIGQLQREREKANRDAVNDPFFFNDAALDIGQRRRWGDLSRAKLDRIRRIEDDYTEMMSAVRLAANQVVLAADRERLEFLEREKQADIAATLSPEELAEYKLRTGSVELGFTRRLSLFQPSETEWRALAQAQLDLNAQFSSTGGFSAANPDQKQAALQGFESRMRSAIGDARYADYLRTTNTEFQYLSHLTEVHRLPSSTASQALQLRDRTAQESNRIFDDPALDDRQKRDALQALAENTRNQLLAQLGPTAGPAYLKNFTQAWLSPISAGLAVTFPPVNPVPTGNGNVAVIGGGYATVRRPPYSPVPVVRQGEIIRGP